MSLDSVGGDLGSATSFVSNFLNNFTIWYNDITWIEWCIFCLFLISLFGFIKLLSWNKSLKERKRWYR